MFKYSSGLKNVKIRVFKSLPGFLRAELPLASGFLRMEQNRETPASQNLYHHISYPIFSSISKNRHSFPLFSLEISSAFNRSDQDLSIQVQFRMDQSVSYTKQMNIMVKTSKFYPFYPVFRKTDIASHFFLQWFYQHLIDLIKIYRFRCNSEWIKVFHIENKWISCPKYPRHTVVGRTILVGEN